MPAVLAASLKAEADPEMSDDVAVLLLTLATENAELREQLAAAQDMLVETAADAGQMHSQVEALTEERDAWRAEAQRVRQRTSLVHIRH